MLFDKRTAVIFAVVFGLTLIGVVIYRKKFLK